MASKQAPYRDTVREMLASIARSKATGGAENEDDTDNADENGSDANADIAAVENNDNDSSDKNDDDDEEKDDEEGPKSTTASSSSRCSSSDVKVISPASQAKRDDEESQSEEQAPEALSESSSSSSPEVIETEETTAEGAMNSLLSSVQVELQEDGADVSDDEEAAEQAAADREVSEIMNNEGDSKDGEADDDEDEIQEVSPEPPKKKKKLEEPEVVEISTDDDEDEDRNDDGDDEDEDEGDPNRPPGEDATSEIAPEHLVPFKLGWKREVVLRKPSKTSGGVTQFDVYYLPPQESTYRTREAKRKRRSKADQEKYFDDFPSEHLTVANFTYVRRPLGLNNAAYEIVRHSRVPVTESETSDGSVAVSKGKSSSKGYKKAASKSYKEVDESQGLVTDSEEEDEEIAFQEGWNLEMPLTLQAQAHSEGMRDMHKKRYKTRDPDTCCTPPLASDILWPELDDDPMGIYTQLGGRSSPSTPPPLRAVKLTRVATAENIRKELKKVQEEARTVSSEKEQKLQDELSSHDYMIRKYKNYRPPKPFLPKAHRSGPPPLRPLPSLSQRVSSSGQFSKATPAGLVPSVSKKAKQPMPFKPCSMACAGQRGVLPTLQCITCKCLFHPRCQGMPASVRAFKCQGCVQKSRQSLQKQQQRKQQLQIQQQQQQQQQRSRLVGLAEAASQRNMVKVKLPMTSSGKRSLVELVMEQNGKYRAIKFSNNLQVTETIARSLFDRANALRRPVYQKAVQVPKINGKQIYLAINPSTPELFAKLFPDVAAQVKNGKGASTSAALAPKPAQVTKAPIPQDSTDQVSILVRPTAGATSRPLLLNLPRKVALKVKVGTTLSFSASNDTKYKVLSTKLHPPVKVKDKDQAANTKTATASSPAIGKLNGQQQQLQQRKQANNQSFQVGQTTITPSSATTTSAAARARMQIFRQQQQQQRLRQHQQRVQKSPSLSTPAGIMASTSATSSRSLPGYGPRAVNSAVRKRTPPAQRRGAASSTSGVLATGEVVSSQEEVTPCTPFCPGASGFPELECSGCGTLFHSKCMGIPQSSVKSIMATFKCRACRVAEPPQVIDLD